MKTETTQPEKISSVAATENFGESTAEMENLRRHQLGENEARSLLLLSAPGSDASKILRRFCEQIFNEQSETIPVYFSIKPTIQSVKNCAAGFLQTFLAQVIAFRLNDAKILDAAPNLNEIGELAAGAEEFWIERLIRNYEHENNFQNEQSFVRSCLSAPLRAAHDAKIFIIFDDLQNAEQLSGETNFVEELKEIYSSSKIQTIFAGRRRYILKAIQSGATILNNAKILRIERDQPATIEVRIEELSKKYHVKINEQSRDLIARLFDLNSNLIESLFIVASRRESDLNSFQKVQQIYVDELFGGAIGKFYDTLFSRIAPDFQAQKSIVNLLYQIAENSAHGKSQIGDWRAYFAMSDSDFYQIMNRLHAEEILNLSSGIIEPERENTILSDYVSARYRLEVLNEQRAYVVSSFLAMTLKRASQLMTRLYRRSSAIDLRGLLAAFNCQQVPAGLIDYAKFKERYKGLSKAETTEKLENEETQITLPETVFTAYGAGFYPAIKLVTDEERLAVGIGFEGADFREENQTAWIVAEIDSKLEAESDAVEFWCDRLEMLALASNFKNYRLWLISPEGFTRDALEILDQRNGYGSSREQIKLLAEFLHTENIVQQPGKKSDEYEIIVPMGDDTELIAAHAVEEIARRHKFQSKAITQIKTALIEACINATEHSMSPDRKIHQKFAVEDNKIIITISNRGVKIPADKIDEQNDAKASGEGRRGWGLKLMRTLMDEVKFERVDDGTRISMVKYLK